MTYLFLYTYLSIYKRSKSQNELSELNVSLNITQNDTEVCRVCYA